MRLRPARLRRGAHLAALASILVSALYFGLGGLPSAAPGRLHMILGLIAPLALGAALLALHLLVARHDLKLAGGARTALETCVLAVAFLFALYHLSTLLHFAAPVALTIDTLLTPAVMHWATLLPGLGVMILTEAAWRRVQSQPGLKGPAQSPEPPPDPGEMNR